MQESSAEKLSGSCCRSCQQQLFGISPSSEDHLKPQEIAADLESLLPRTLMLRNLGCLDSEDNDSLSQGHLASHGELRERLSGFLIEK